MKLNTKHRIGEIQGRAGTFRIVQQARRNARVIPVDLTLGEEIGDSELVSSNLLINIRYYQASAEISRTIRIPSRLHDRLARFAQPFETPADVIERLSSVTFPGVPLKPEEVPALIMNAAIARGVDKAVNYNWFRHDWRKDDDDASGPEVLKAYGKIGWQSSENLGPPKLWHYVQAQMDLLPGNEAGTSDYIYVDTRYGAVVWRVVVA